MPLSVITITGSHLRAFDYEEITVGAVVATPDGNKAAASRLAEMSLEGGALRYRVDGGAPTTVVGHALWDTDKVTLTANEITGLQMIRQGAVSGTVRITYYQ